MKYLILLISVMSLLFTASCKQSQKERKETNPKLQKIDEKSFTNSAGMKMIYLTDDYWVSAYETTKKEYVKIMSLSRKIPLNEENWPIAIVSFNQAEKFCKELTKYETKHGRLPSGYVYSLPTEKMWRDYVANAKYKDAFFNGFMAKKPFPVGTLAPNRLGLYDVRGNVFEWTSSWYNPKKKKWGRVIRGGSFLSNTLEYWDVDNRACMFGGGARSLDVGFRVVLVSKKR